MQCMQAAIRRARRPQHAAAGASRGDVLVHTAQHAAARLATADAGDAGGVSGDELGLHLEA